MAIQNRFQIDHDQAYNGMIADGQLHNIVSRLNVDDATIPFGTPVWDTAGGATMKSADGLFVGLAVREVANRNYHEGTVAGFGAGKDMSVMNAGVMWIQLPAGVTVSAGDKVNFDTTTGLFVATGGTELPNAEWLTDGEFAKLRLTIGA